MSRIDDMIAKLEDALKSESDELNRGRLKMALKDALKQKQREEQEDE
jgi:hypothetical protein